MNSVPEEHELLRQTVRELAEAKIAPFAAEVDEAARFPQEALDALTAARLHAVHIPEAFGGEGASIFKVNLIPYNPTAADGSDPYRGSTRESIAAFRGALQSRGMDATVRLTRGRDIDAACGQLAARNAAGQG